MTHLGSLQFRTDRDGDPDSDTDPDELGQTSRFTGQAKATPF